MYIINVTLFRCEISLVVNNHKCGDLEIVSDKFSEYVSAVSITTSCLDDLKYVFICIIMLLTEGPI